MARGFPFQRRSASFVSCIPWTRTRSFTLIPRGIGRGASGVEAPRRSAASTRGAAGMTGSQSKAAAPPSAGGSADRLDHLELNQAIQLDGVLHRQLLRDRLDEAVHDHRGRLLLGEAARLEVEE